MVAGAGYDRFVALLHRPTSADLRHDHQKYRGDVVDLGAKLIMTHSEHELIADLAEALRLLHDYQNGPPLEKYENQWNKAMRLTELVLPRAEAWLVRKVTLDESP